MTVSGTLTQTAASDVTNDVVAKSQASFATTSTNISLDCGAAGIFSAVVDSSTGAFSASGVPTGVPCSFSFVNATSGANKCQVQFQDSSNYDLNHNSVSTNTSVASGAIAMGAITCDTTGTVTVPVSSVSGVSSGATLGQATAFNFTGVWTAASYTGTLPTNGTNVVYQTISNCTQNCHGPSVGQVISLIRFHGVKFTPTAGQCTPAINVSCPLSSGTDDPTKDGYAMSIWGGDYAHGIGACGGNTGFSLGEARAYAGLDLDQTPPSLSGNVLNYAHYAWGTPTGFGTDTGWTQPWMYGGATSQYSIQDCQPVSIPSTSGAAAKPGMACFSQVQTFAGAGTGVYVWSVGMQSSGGCVDASGAPLMVNNWAAINPTSCTNTASVFNSNMNTSSCTYTGSPVAGQSSQTFTCSNTFGAFKDLSGATTAGSDNGPDFTNAYAVPNGDNMAQPATLLAQGAACASGTSEASYISTASGAPGAAQALASKQLLARYQCYANAYWQHSSNGAGSLSCSRNYNFNWSTNTYANFVSGDDRSMKPQNAFITDRVIYSPDGKWGFLKNTSTQYQSIPTASGSVLCALASTIQMKFQQLSSTQLAVYFTQSGVVTDTSATCQAAVSAAYAGAGKLTSDPTGLNNLYNELAPQNLVFLLNKQGN